MAKAAKKKPARKPAKQALTGDFVVAPPAVRSNKVSTRQIRNAILKLNKARQARAS